MVCTKPKVKSPTEPRAAACAYLSKPELIRNFGKYHKDIFNKAIRLGAAGGKFLKDLKAYAKVHKDTLVEEQLDRIIGVHKAMFASPK